MLTSGSEGRPSRSRHGSSWGICRACLCCAVSGGTAEADERERVNDHSNPVTHTSSQQGTKMREQLSEERAARTE